jgi:hypothetical protein
LYAPVDASGLKSIYDIPEGCSEDSLEVALQIDHYINSYNIFNRMPDKKDIQSQLSWQAFGDFLVFALICTLSLLLYYLFFSCYRCCQHSYIHSCIVMCCLVFGSILFFVQVFEDFTSSAIQIFLGTAKQLCKDYISEPEKRI